MPTNLLIGYPDIPQSAVKIDSNNSFGTNTPVHNLRAGERFNIAKLTSATAGLTRVNFDLGATTKASNYLAIARADRLQAALCGRVVLRGSSASAYTVSGISGLRGWWESTRGITTATGISQIDDLSGTGAHMSQGTGANQPIWTRGDNKENQLLYSAELDNAAWTKSNCTITANAVTGPTGTMTADKIVENTAVTVTHYAVQTVNVISGKSYVATGYVKSAGRTAALVEVTSGATDVFNYVDLTTGARISGSATVTITDAGSGWWKVAVPFTAAAATALTYSFPTISSNATYTGDGTSGIYSTQWYLRESTADDSYIETTGTAYHAGTNDNRAALYDGSNDALTATGTTINVTGALTTFCVFYTNAGTSDGGLFGNGITTHTQLTHHNGGLLYFYVGDGGNALSTSASTRTVNIVICTWDGTTGANSMAMYLNSGSGPLFRTSTLTPSNTANYGIGGGVTGPTNYNGRIFECGIYNRVISASEVTSLYNYLATKWQTTAPGKTNTFATDTLYGPRSDDYYTTFTASSAFRHWWVDYEPTASGSLEHSKLYFGSYFDFGFDPDDIRMVKLEPRASREFTASGAAIFAKNEQSVYRFEITWRRVTDDLVRDFNTKVVNQTYRNRGVFLMTTSDHTVLDNQRIIHCRLISAECDSEDTDQNMVRCIFEEVTG